MAEVNIKTRLSLRYDTLANWNSANPVLNKGEVAVVAIPSGATGESTYGQDTKPSILFKVGDGTSNFKALPYASARAADVYEWAKASSKPSYVATEISFSNNGDSDLASTTVGAALNELRNKDAEINQSLGTLRDSVYKKSETYTKTEIDKAIEDMAGDIQGALEADTNTKYQIVFDSATGIIKLQSKDIGETSWKDISGQSFDLTTLTVAKAKGVSTTYVAGGTNTTLRMPLINDNGEFVEGASDYSSLGKGVKVEKGAFERPLIDADIKGNAATANTAMGATVAESANKDGKGNVIDTTYATKAELNSHVETVGPQISALQGNFTEGAAKKAIADKNGNDITTTYVAKSTYDGLAETVQELEAGYQELDGYFTTSGEAIEAVKATKDGNDNVIVDTYATKTEVGAVDTKVTNIGNTVNAAISQGKAKEAIKANQDSDGNIITETYATKQALNSLAQDLDELDPETIGAYTKAEVDDLIQGANDFAVEEATSAASGAVSPLLSGTKTVKKAEQDASGNVITSTYATKTELSTGLSGKADSSALSQQVSRLEGLIEDAVDEVTEIANGKTKTYVLSYTPEDSSCNGNAQFNSNSDTIDLTQSHKTELIDGSILNTGDLKIGDIILVKETNVPDRWVMSVSGSGTFTLAKMETSKVELSGYVQSSTFNGQIERVEPAKVYATMPSAVGTSTSLTSVCTHKINEWLNTVGSTPSGASYPEIEIHLLDNQRGIQLLAKPTRVDLNAGEIIAEARYAVVNGAATKYIFRVNPSSIQLADERTELGLVQGSDGVKVTTSNGTATVKIDTDTVFVLNGGNAAGAYN